jgi:hypothetical protein
VRGTLGNSFRDGRQAEDERAALSIRMSGLGTVRALSNGRLFPHTEELTIPPPETKVNGFGSGSELDELRRCDPNTLGYVRN